MSSPKRRALLWSIIGILLIWVANELWKTKDAGGIPLNDYVEYWSACRIFVAGGNPYDATGMMKLQLSLGWTDSRPLMMWNPPWTIPLLLPFCLLPFWVGRGLWLLLNLVLVLMIADWFWRQYGGPISRRWIAWLATLLFLPVGTSLFLGQISPMVLAGLAGFVWAIDRKRYTLAGLCTLLVSVKPHLLYLFWIFFFLWVAGKRRWQVLMGALLSILVSSLLVALLNPSDFANYFEAFISGDGPQIWQTPTWGIALAMLFPESGAWIRFLPSLLGLGVACWLWSIWRLTFDWMRQLPVIVLLSVTTSSFTWMFDWVVLLPAVIMILCWFQAQPARRWWALGALALMQPLLVLSTAVSHTNFYTLWLPPALWLLYWASSRVRPAGEQAATSAA